MVGGVDQAHHTEKGSSVKKVPFSAMSPTIMNPAHFARDRVHTELDGG